MEGSVHDGPQNPANVKQLAARVREGEGLQFGVQTLNGRVKGVNHGNRRDE